MYYAKINYPILGPPEIRHLLVCRGFSGFFGIWGIYYSLQYLSLSDAVVLTFLSPLCTAIAGAILLKEKFTKIEALSGIISLLGTVLIARPPFIFDTLSKNSSTVVDEGTTAEQRVVAVGVALIGVLGITGACITIRAAGKRAHLLHNMAYFSGTCIIVSTIAMAITHTSIVIPSEWLFLGMLILICVFGFIAQTLMTMGLQIEAAGRATMGFYTQVIFALILERAVFGTVPQALSILGTVLILGPALYVAVMKEKEGAGKIALPADNNERGAEEGLVGSHEAGVASIVD
ncbi:hypothetical protein AX15_000746 [Amanita polypyramis BW_CC]|nr:hypothetical protein AX15_000746 [Amanita polypyramis BW_CC]